MVVAIPARNVPDLLKSAVDTGVAAAVVLSSGFAEAGPDGQSRQAQLEALSEERSLLICGPNCWGVFNVLDKSPVISSSIPPTFLAGDVALVSQSGSLSMYISKPLMENHGVGFSYVVSCGNQAGVTIEEYINYFVEDDRTRVIAAFVEGFRRPQSLRAVAKKALSRNKPIIVMKVGKSDVARQSTLAHSGSLAGAAEVVEAVLRQSGIVQVHGLNEMLETIALLSCSSVRTCFSGGRRVGVFSGAGGECSYVADVAEEVGLQLPDLAETTKTRLREILPDFGSARNPLDGTGAMYEDAKMFSPMLQALAEDPNIDLVAVSLPANDLRPSSVAENRRFAGEIGHIADNTSKPIVVFGSIVGGANDPQTVLTLRGAGVPFLDGADFAIAACANLVRYHEFCQSARRDIALGQGRSSFSQADLSAGVLPMRNAFRLLETFGIPVVPTILVQTVDEAVAAATQVGFPVVLKVESPSVQHKSDVGGVVLGVATPEAVRDTFCRIHQEVAARAPAAEIAGILVQPMVPQGIEVILGIKCDPMFGPVIICGLGGIFVEILRDVAIGLPPLSREQAREIIRQLRMWEILAGARGRPPADVDALSDAIVSLSRLALTLRDRIVALDINPLIVYGEGKGVLAVDALVQVR